MSAPERLAPLDALQDARARLEIDGRVVDARIVELSETGLVVALDRGASSAIAPGLAVPECLADIPGVFDGKRLRGLRVEACERIDAGEQRVRMVGGAAARASLWLAVEKLAAGVERAGPRAGVPAAEIPKIPARGVSTEEARRARLAFARSLSGASLATMAQTSIPAEKLSKNIEAFVGTIEVPVGLAGPLLVHGEHAKGLFLAPMATTEGTLVASTTRGATALTRAGGVTARVLRQSMQRAPVFVFRDVAGAALFARLIGHHVPALREETSKVSRHGVLTKVEAYTIGREVHVVFDYETADAAGQNMTSAMTWHACKWLLEECRNVSSLTLERFQVEGNMSGDKKFAFRSLINGRGFRVAADCYLPHAVVRDVLKVEPKALVEANESGMRGALQAGMAGYSINASNAIAAIFTATGQDIACVYESSAAIFSTQLLEDAVYASMLLPSVVVGTVGGGTHLPHQKEMLELMGCGGRATSARFAELVASFCLGLDLSTLAAVASDQFVHAHERLGRNRPVRPLQLAEIDAAFFAKATRALTDDPSARVIEAAPLAGFHGGSSMVSELTERRVTKAVGLFPYRLRCEGEHGATERDVMVKLKPTAAEVVLAAKGIASLCSPELSAAFARHAHVTGLGASDVRELGVYRLTDLRLRAHMPRVYDVVEDASREMLVAITEFLRDVVLLDSADAVSAWREEHVEAALRGAASVHAVWLGREAELAAERWLGPHPTARAMTEALPLWSALTEHAAREFPEWYPAGDVELARALVHAIPAWWRDVETHPRTLIHNDFSPRNICLRPEGTGYRLCAYDWELATLHLPQHDLAELLAFTIAPEDVGPDRVEHYVEFHRVALEEASGRALDAAQWRDGYRLALWDLAVHRVPLMAMAHTVREYPFMERVHRALWRLIHLEGGLPPAGASHAAPATTRG